MIDFYKSALVGQKACEWLENPNLRQSFKTIVSNETGLIREQRAFYRGQTICVKPGGYVEIYGSIHKFHTGNTNATDFTRVALALSIDELGEELRFNPSAARLQNVEFGVNIAMSMPAKALLSRAILYGNAEFTARRTFDGNGYQLDAKRQRYTFKPYDKAAELMSHGYSCDGHLLRVEARVTKMAHLAHGNIETLADLKQPQNLAPLGLMLGKMWDNILFCDHSINLEGLSKPRRELLMNGRNAAYWESLKSDNFRKQRKQFRVWNDEYSNDLHPILAGTELSTKWAELLLN
jgi:hypothetical protein